MNHLKVPNNKNNNLPNKTLIELEKRDLLKFISKSISKNISKVKQIFLGQKFRFGNQIKIISRVIFFCEILGCKNIILDKNSKNWFIKKKIVDKIHKLKIYVDSINNIKYKDTIFDRTTNFYYYSNYIFPKLKIDLIKNEILNNLPKINTDSHDLYIYIRSGDIFIRPHPKYTQPPLCFYEKILNEFEFKSIYLISQNTNNPVINSLLNNFPYIIYQEQALELDISKLVKAYNLVGGCISTFFSAILELNINLQILFFFQLNEQPLNQSKKINIKYFYQRNLIKKFIMYAKKDYLRIMKPWKNTLYQRNYMKKYNCSNFFLIE